jgi:hypothetical protein
MKLSSFKLNTVKKTLSFKGGESTIESVGSSFYGDIHFFDISEQMLINIYDNVMAKLGDVDFDDTEFAYHILPYICDIEVDVSLDEFNKMVDNPSKQFVDFVGVVTDSIREMLEMINSISEIKNKTQSFQVDIKVLKQEELDELYNQLPTISDRKEKRDILAKINELEKELDALE